MTVKEALELLKTGSPVQKVEARYVLAEVFEARGLWEDAAACYEACVKAGDGSPQLLRRLSNAYLRAGKEDAADAALAEVHRLESNMGGQSRAVRIPTARRPEETLSKPKKVDVLTNRDARRGQFKSVFFASLLVAAIGSALMGGLLLNDGSSVQQSSLAQAISPTPSAASSEAAVPLATASVTTSPTVDPPSTILDRPTTVPTAGPNAAIDTSLAGGVRYIANTDAIGVRLRSRCSDEGLNSAWPEGMRVYWEGTSEACPGWARVRNEASSQSSWVRLQYLSSEPVPPRAVQKPSNSPVTQTRPTLSSPIPQPVAATLPSAYNPPRVLERPQSTHLQVRLTSVTSLLGWQWPQVSGDVCNNAQGWRAININATFNLYNGMMISLGGGTQPLPDVRPGKCEYFSLTLRAHGNRHHLRRVVVGRVGQR